MPITARRRLRIVKGSRQVHEKQNLDKAIILTLKFPKPKSVILNATASDEPLKASEMRPEF